MESERQSRTCRWVKRVSAFGPFAWSHSMHRSFFWKLRARHCGAEQDLSGRPSGTSDLLPAAKEAAGWKCCMRRPLPPPLLIEPFSLRVGALDACVDGRWGTAWAMRARVGTWGQTQSR